MTPVARRFLACVCVLLLCLILWFISLHEHIENQQFWKTAAGAASYGKFNLSADSKRHLLQRGKNWSATSGHVALFTYFDFPQMKAGENFC